MSNKFIFFIFIFIFVFGYSAYEAYKLDSLVSTKLNIVSPELIETLPSSKFESYITEKQESLAALNEKSFIIVHFLSPFLFKEVQNCLKLGGRFVLVANKHLNYATHLEQIFTEVATVNTNKKFVVYECFK